MTLEVVKMSYMHTLKNIATPGMLQAFRVIKNLKDVPSYYYPYLALNGKAKTLSKLSIELTYKCNLKCIMCPQANELKKDNSALKKAMQTEKEIGIEVIRKVLKEATDIGVKAITFTGGEPFMRKDILEILEEAKKYPITCTIISNGGVIKDEQIKRIVEIGVDKIIFSLDGPKDIHNQIRGNNKTFDNLIKNTAKFQEEKNSQNKNIPDVSFNCTISSENYKHLEEIMDIAKENKININYTYLYYTTKEMQERTLQLLQHEKIKEEDQDIDNNLKEIDPKALITITKRIINNQKKYKINANFTPSLNEEEIKKRFNDDNYSFVDKCFYPWFATRIDPFGNVYPCSMSIKLGNIKTDTLPNIWNNKKYTQFRRSLRKNGLFPKCKKCCALENRIWNYLPRMTSKQ
jgi:radical SAM protein with 4Fe4S-binding SPASM domain